MWPWSELGLDGPADLAAVRRAYAQRLKETHPEDDPEGFQRLHSAYQQARRMARSSSQTGPEPENRRDAVPDDQPPPPQEKPPKTQPEQDWDFDTLFAQGEEDRRQARERTAVSDALQAMAVLLYAEASTAEWNTFLHSEAFLSVQHHPAFLSGLENFLLEHPDLSVFTRRQIFLVYQFYLGPPPEQYRRLYRLLKDSYDGPAYRKAQQKARREARRQERKQAAQFCRKNRDAVLVLLLIPLTLVVSLAGMIFQRATEEKPLELLQKYLQEDFGIAAERVYHTKNDGNYFSLHRADDSSFRFYAIYTGNRDLASGNLGYTTNYPNKLFFYAMRSFSDKWPEYPLYFDRDRMDSTGTRDRMGEPPQLFLFELPRTGAEAFIDDLTRQLAALEKTDWYQTLPPEFEIYFCCGDSTVSYYSTGPGEPFDGEKVLQEYAQMQTENKPA